MIYFDTLKHVEILRAAGISEVHAKAISAGQQMAMSEYRERAFPHALATKADIDRLDIKLEHVKTDVEHLKTDVKHLKVDVSDLKADMRVVKWMLGFFGTGIMALVTGMILEHL